MFFSRLFTCSKDICLHLVYSLMSPFAGNVWTAAAHIITAVIGSGVLSLAWSMAQLGWIAGPVALLGFAVVTYFTSLLLTDCYRSPVTGKRNYTYMDAVRANLGLMLVLLLYS